MFVACDRISFLFRLNYSPLSVYTTSCLPIIHGGTWVASASWPRLLFKTFLWPPVCHGLKLPPPQSLTLLLRPFQNLVSSCLSPSLILWATLYVCLSASLSAYLSVCLSMSMSLATSGLFRGPQTHSAPSCWLAIAHTLLSVWIAISS